MKKQKKPKPQSTGRFFEAVVWVGQGIGTSKGYAHIKPGDQRAGETLLDARECRKLAKWLLKYAAWAEQK